jgi:hypothetical protein
MGAAVVFGSGFVGGTASRTQKSVLSSGATPSRHIRFAPRASTVFSLTEKTVVLQQSFKYFVLPKALKPYKMLQKCQKLLANLGSEDTV